MKNNYFLAFIVLLLSGSVQAQCTGGRYTTQIFPSATVTSDVLYGNNVNLSGNAQDLFLDVYTGTGDTETNRPLLILEHGGSFIGGSKTGGDVVPLAEDFAQMGYVVTSIQYRLGMEGIPFPGPDSVTATESVVRAYHDMKAAIRFFWKDARENGNQYGIDTNQIYVGGVSAGAIGALHVAYLDDLSELPTYIDTSAAGMGGGLEGTSGSPGYPSTIQGIINIAGALRDTSWIQPGDVPLLSLHGDADGTVPYNTDIISVSGLWQIVEVDGSSSIAIRADNIGLTHCFETHEGEDHVPHAGNAAIYDTTVTLMRNFLSSQVCGTQLDCSYNGTVLSLDDQVDLGHKINAYPNPMSETLVLDLTTLNSNNVRTRILDALGRVVYDATSNDQILRLDVSDFSNGMYLIDITGENWKASKKILK